MSFPGRRLLPWAGAVVAILFAAVLTLFFPPRVLLRAAADRWLPPASQWTSVGRAHTRCFVRGLVIPARPMGLRADAVTLTCSVPSGLVSGEWRFEVDRTVLLPADPRWPELTFRSGKGRWIAGGRRLELRDWVSEYALVNADLEWDVAGRVRLARVWGDADLSSLQKAFSAWKPLKADGFSPVARLPFELSYQKGQFLIRVNEKPFFRASWRSDGAF
jgi:hypothetical protein